MNLRRRSSCPQAWILELEFRKSVEAGEEVFESRTLSSEVVVVGEVIVGQEDPKLSLYIYF